MHTDDSSLAQLKNSPLFGFAAQRLIFDRQGRPCDFEFLAVNAAFERMTGLRGTDILNRRVTAILPEIRQDDFDWIATFAEVARSGQPKEFEQYARALNGYYRVYVYSPQTNHFCTLFVETTYENVITEAAQTLHTYTAASVDYQEITERMRRLTGARYALLNIRSRDGKEISTAAVAGDRQGIQQATTLLQYQLIGKRWSLDAPREEQIRRQKTTFFADLVELTAGDLASTTARQLAQTLQIEEVALIKAEREGNRLGDFVLYFAPSHRLQNLPTAETYADMVGMLIARLQTETSLWEKDEHLQATLFSIGDGVISIDRQARITLMNRVAEQMTGWAILEAEGRSVDEVFYIVNSYSWAKAENPLHRALREGIVLGAANHTTLIARDGTERQISSSCAPILAEDGSVTGAVLVFRDVTEQYRQREQHRIMSSALAASLNAIAIADLSGTLTYVNPAFLQLWGYEQIDEVLGRHSTEFWHPEENPQAVIEALQQHNFWRGEMTARRRDGSLFPVELAACKVVDSDGNPLCIQASFIDISQRAHHIDE